MALQMDLFWDKNESAIYELSKNTKFIKSTLDKVRKSHWSEINTLKKVYVEMHARLEIIERNICNGK